jgi:hypothetical protein
VRKVPLRKSCDFNKLKFCDQGFLWIISRLLVENAISHLPLDLLQQTALPLLLPLMPACGFRQQPFLVSAHWKIELPAKVDAFETGGADMP